VKEVRIFFTLREFSHCDGEDDDVIIVMTSFLSLKPDQFRQELIYVSLLILKGVEEIFAFAPDVLTTPKLSC